MPERSPALPLSTLLPLPADLRCTQCHGSRLFPLKKYAGIEVFRCSGGGCDQKYQRPVLRKPRSNSAADQPASRGAVEYAPLTVHDRVQAVRRSPTFISEAQAFLSKTEREMRAIPRELQRLRLIRDLIDNEVARKWDVPPDVVLGAGAMALNGRPHRSSDESKRPAIPEGHARTMMVRDVRDCRHLVLEIDLTLPEPESLKHVQAEISRYQTLLGLHSERRKKPLLVDPWTIYDQVHIDKLNTLKITHRLFGCEGRPEDNDVVSKNYKRVRRAYQRAIAMIKSVSRSNPS